MKLFKNKKAITLISLVVTIVVLVILAAVAINMAISNNGLLNKTKLAKEEYVNASEKEKEDMDVLVNDVDISTNTRSIVNTNGIKMTSIKKLTNAVMANSLNNVRNAGTYNASSTSFSKTDSADCGNYLEFIVNTGWKVKKSGWYYIQAISRAEYPSTNAGNGNCSTYLKINGTEMKISNSEYVGNIYYTAEDEPNITLWFEENDIIDYKYVITTNARYSYASIDIYAMFE